MHNSGTLKSADSTIHFNPGTIIKIPPGIVHQETSPHGYRNYAVLFNDTGAPREIKVYDLSVNHIAFVIASALHSVYSENDGRHAQILRYLLEAFLQSIEQDLPSSELMANLKKIIHDNIENAGFRIGPALAGMAVSRDHARRLFKSAIGSSPLAYLQTLRMQRAQELLLLGYSVKETAFCTGFEDQLYFSRLFTKKVGVRPSKYSKQNCRS